MPTPRTTHARYVESLALDNKHLRRELAEAEARIRDLTAGLINHGVHLPGCAPYRGPCTCGLKTIIEGGRRG